MKTSLRIALILLFCVTVIFCFNSTAFAENIDSGTWGNLTWALDENDALTISGNGEMNGFLPDSNDAWRNYKSRITSVNIESGITSIGRDAFNGFINLTSITIPESVTSIGHFAFQDCSSLADITIPASVTYIGSFAFGNCSSLTSIKIPEGVTSIYGAFSGCTSLTSITIPVSVTSIEYGAFDGCSSLTGITIPESVTSIQFYAFSGCSSLTDVYYGGTNVQWFSVDIEPYNEELFNAAIHFTDVINNFSDSGTWDHLNWTVQLSDEYLALTISGNGDMNDFPRPSSDAWRKYKSHITSVHLESGITSIGDAAFYGFSNLTSITIPESMTSIGHYAFQDCSSLTAMTIPEGVTFIGDFAFASFGCSSLSSITIPESMENIGSYAFTGCSSLTDVYYAGTQAQWQTINMESGNDYLINATIHYNDVIPDPVDYTIDLPTYIVIPPTFKDVSDETMLVDYRIEYIHTLRCILDNYDILWYYKPTTGPVGHINWWNEIDGTEYEYMLWLFDTNLTIDPYEENREIVSTEHSPDGSWLRTDYDFNGSVIMADYSPSGSNKTYSWDPALQTWSYYNSEIGNTEYCDFDGLTPYHVPFYAVHFTGETLVLWDSGGSHDDVTPDFFLPNSLTEIQEEAFTGGAFHVVQLPEETISIGKRAFADCPNLTHIYIPNETTSIASDAFDNVNGLTIFGKTGSTAEAFANAHEGFSFIAIS